MYCKYCGSLLKDNARFCTACGKPAEVAIQSETTPVVNNVPVQPQPTPVQPQPAPVQPQPTPVQPQPVPISPVQPAQYQQPVSTPAPAVSNEISDKQSSILTFGILALAFAISFFVSFMGIVFGIITMNKVKEYVQLMGETTGRASVGKGLGKAGLIVGIVLTSIFVLYIALIVILALAASGAYYY